MNLIRKYKISKLLNKPIEGVVGEIINLIQYWLKDLTPFKWDKKPDSIFYMNSEGLYVVEYVLELDIIDKILWVRYKDFWEILEHKYLLNFDDASTIITYMVEEKLKHKISSAHYRKLIEHYQVEIEEVFAVSKSLSSI